MKVCSLCRRCYDDPTISCAEDGHPALSEARNGDREMIPGYKLDFLHELAGSSEIYRSTQKISGQSCLIKILTADENEGRKFLDEAKIASTFFHPSVADIYETGISNIGEPYLVMEDVNGETLRDNLGSVGAPKLLTAVQIARQAAEALHAIHLNGLTHRAINPANIILTTDVEHHLLVKIQNFDFGGVSERLIASNRFLSDSDLYSLRYFAPEQCSGQTASPQTDVYSLGVVLYEMLAGVPPFEGQTAAALMDQHLNRPVPEIKIDNFDLRMLLAHTLTESLQKRPKVRQSSANAFARQFRHIEQLGTHSSTPPPAGAVLPAHKVVAAATAFIPAKVAPSVPSFKVKSEAASIEDPFQQKTAFEYGRSQLKLRKKRARAKTALATARTRECKSLTSTGSMEVKRVEDVSQLIEAPTIPVEPKKITVVPIHNRPRKIEWQPPAEDFPSEAAVLETLSKEYFTETPVVEPNPEKIDVAAVQNDPTRIEEWPRSENALHSEPGIPEVRSVENISEHSTIEAEEEEITLVRKPIRIQWEQPSLRGSDEIQFLPTILGGWGKNETVDAIRDDSMFAYYSRSGEHFSVPHRSLMISGGVMLLFALFLFGSAPIRKYLQTAGSGESVEAKSVLPGGPRIGQPAAAYISKKKAQKSTEKPPTTQDNDADDGRSKPLPAKERSPRSTDKQQNSDVKADPIPATLVIYSENGKTKSKYIAGDSKDETPLPLRDKSANPGRPRIVKNPER